MRTTVRSRKEDCSGCGACASVCPKGAVSMKPDREGFLYPAVDSSLCVECGLCEKKCPFGKANAEHEKPEAFGASAMDAELRKVSSSGGVFTLLSRKILEQGGVVFGAAFDEKLHVEHIGVMEERELASLRGSKYVQSDSADAICNACGLLKQGIPVLFSGTPCQIDGLLAAVPAKDRKLLTTVDFICHGVPSPAVFESYLRELQQGGRTVVAYSFRDKRYGWKDFSASAVFEDGGEHTGTQTEEIYLRGFLQNLYLRPSCHNCTKLRGTGHVSDITIGDLWGAQKICPEKDDDTGLSLVFANTEKGKKLLDSCRQEMECFHCETGDLLRFNPSIETPAVPHRNRAKFMRAFEKEGFRSQTVEKLLMPPGKLEQLAARAAHLPAGLMRRAGAVLKGEKK